MRNKTKEKQHPREVAPLQAIVAEGNSVCPAYPPPHPPTPHPPTGQEINKTEVALLRRAMMAVVNSVFIPAGPRSSRMRSGFTHNYAERYVERFTVTTCSEELVTYTHNVSLLIREDLRRPRMPRQDRRQNETCICFAWNTKSHPLEPDRATD